MNARPRALLPELDERKLFGLLPDTAAREELARRFLPLAEYLATDVLGWAPPGNGGNGTDAPADGQPVITHSAVME